jgi:hypothetical protein
MALLKKGDQSPEVKELQTTLTQKGYYVDADGKFGEATVIAVKTFQKSVGLAADGVAGKDTLGALQSVKAPAAAPSVSILNQIPMPAANRSRSAAMPTLQAVATITGASAKLLATFASIESSFDYLVKADTSSAVGWFQHLDATWDDCIRLFGKQYGITSDPGRKLRLDPRMNALMGAHLLLDNARILKSKIGREPTDVDLYAAHFFGVGTAARFLTAPTSGDAVALFPKQAEANEGIFYVKGRPRTIGEVIATFESKVAKHRA